MRETKFKYIGNELVTTIFDENDNVIEISSDEKIYKSAEYDEHRNQTRFCDHTGVLTIHREFRRYNFITKYEDSHGNYWDSTLKTKFIFTRRIFMNFDEYNEFNLVV
jgi:hypothetical protein